MRRGRGLFPGYHTPASGRDRLLVAVVIILWLWMLMVLVTGCTPESAPSTTRKARCEHCDS